MTDEIDSAIHALKREVVAIEEDPRSASSLLGKAEHLVRMLKLGASANVLERAENALLRTLSERCLRRTVLGATSKGSRLPQRERQLVQGGEASAVNGPVGLSLPVSGLATRQLPPNPPKRS